jgi:uncharacterized protein (TIGR03790 family)
MLNRLKTLLISMGLIVLSAPFGGCGQNASSASGPAASVPPAAVSASASQASEPAAVPASSVVKLSPRRAWATDIARPIGRLTARDIGLVINTADPYSQQVGEHYIKARHLAPSQVLRVNLPVNATLTIGEFEALSDQIQAYFGPQTQALALAWARPYAVECNSITGALALGFNGQLCSNSCSPSKLSPYFNAPTTRPYSDLGMRPTMLMAAKDVPSAIALIDRGVQSDGSLGLRGGPPVYAHFVITHDSVRSIRQVLFPPAGALNRVGVDVRIDETDALQNEKRVLLYMTGAVRVPKIETVRFVPGALADHLTSFGGSLDYPNGQMTVLSWIEAGATASYGTVSEPCAHWQKFSHPQILLGSYVQGSTAIEAYWRSVAWPQQGLFVGEPLAAPFSHLP